MVFKRFEEIDAWKEARELTRLIYITTSSEKFRKDFGLKDQLQRAAVSIMLNIAEGFEAGSHKSFAHFLQYSYRSGSEVKSIFYIALDLNYITQEEFNSFIKRIDLIRRLLCGLIKYLKTN